MMLLLILTMAGFSKRAFQIEFIKESRINRDEDMVVELQFIDLKVG